MGLTSTLEGIVLGQKYNEPKSKLSIIKRDGNVLISTKNGTIIASTINGKLRLQDNDTINSWNSDIKDHIRSFKTSIAKIDKLPTSPINIKNRIICFGNGPEGKRKNTYTYPTISIDRLNELYDKGYRYFITTSEEHLIDEVLEWIRGYPETRWIHLKIKKNTKLSPNSISYDHRWYMLDILEKELPGKCILINRPEDQSSDKPVVLCNFDSEDEWKRLEYKKGHYYWSINPTTYHHNSIRVFTDKVSLIDDAISVFQYYSIHQHKPENTPLGRYIVDRANQRRFELFTKYVVHDGDEINTYIIHSPYVQN